MTPLPPDIVRQKAEQARDVDVVELALQSGDRRDLEFAVALSTCWKIQEERTTPHTKPGVGTFRHAWSWSRKHWLVSTASTLLILSLITGVAWAIFYTRPLLYDNFDDNLFNASDFLHQPDVHEIGIDVTVDGQVIKTPVPMGVANEGGKQVLVNRGFLITRKELPQPVSLSFKWSWSGVTLRPRYGETLAVALRTSGKVDPNHPYEVVDGVVIKFVTWGSYITIARHEGGEHRKLTSTEDKGITLTIPPNEEHTVTVTDDGRSIAVYLEGPHIDEKYANMPLLRIPVEGTFAGHRIAIYNREFVGGIPHISHIDDYRLESLDVDE